MRRKKKYTETEFRTKLLIPLLTRKGFRVHKMTEKFKTGWPDLLVIQKGTGITAFVETKIDDNTLTPLQSDTLNGLAKDACLTYVIRYINKINTTEVFRVIYGGIKNGAPSTILKEWTIDLLIMDFKHKGGGYI